MTDNDNNIRFVARHYCKGLFSADAAWRRLGIAPSMSIWRRYRVAAVLAGAIALSAAAAIIYHQYDVRAEIESETLTLSPMETVKVVDFENAPLPVVVERIREVYGVEVDGLPENADDYVLSLHYEGTPVDLVDTINDLLSTEMTVK